MHLGNFKTGYFKCKEKKTFQALKVFVKQECESQSWRLQAQEFGLPLGQARTQGDAQSSAEMGKSRSGEQHSETVEKALGFKSENLDFSLIYLLLAE